MENRVEKLPSLGYDEVDRCEVAVTTMAFKNGEIIHKLRERGNAIKNSQWDKQALLEKEINDLKNRKFREFITPCSVFMTFDTEEGVNRALEMKNTIASNQEFRHLGIWLGVHEIEIKAASEPSDIIWENRQFTRWDRRKKEIVSTIVMFFLLLASCIVIFIFFEMSEQAERKYPIVKVCS